MLRLALSDEQHQGICIVSSRTRGQSGLKHPSDALAKQHWPQQWSWRWPTLGRGPARELLWPQRVHKDTSWKQAWHKIKSSILLCLHKKCKRARSRPTKRNRGEQNLWHITQCTKQSREEWGELQPHCAYSPKNWRNQPWIWIQRKKKLTYFCWT